MYALLSSTENATLKRLDCLWSDVRLLSSPGKRDWDFWTLALFYHIFVPNHRHFEVITNQRYVIMRAWCLIAWTSCDLMFADFIYIDQKFVKRVHEKSKSCIECFTSKIFIDRTLDTVCIAGKRTITSTLRSHRVGNWRYWVLRTLVNTVADCM